MNIYTYIFNWEILYPHELCLFPGGLEDNVLYFPNITKKNYRKLSGQIVAYGLW